MLQVSGRPGDDTRECIYNHEATRPSLFARLHSYALMFKAI